MIQIKVFSNPEPEEVERAANEWLALNPDVEIMSIVQSESKRSPRYETGGLMLRGSRSAFENSSLSITVVYKKK